MYKYKRHALINTENIYLRLVICPQTRQNVFTSRILPRHNNCFITPLFYYIEILNSRATTRTVDERFRDELDLLL